MAITYNLVERPEPGVAGGGQKKWYAAAVNNGSLNIDDISKEIEKFSTLSEADIHGVIIALEQVIIREIGNGKIINLDKLGSFYPSLSSNGALSPKEFNTSYIKTAKLNYRPGKRINKALKLIQFRKVK